MNSQDVKDLIDYIMENNSWDKCSYLFKGVTQPKYINFNVDFRLDTRDGICFVVSFETSKGQNGRSISKNFEVENKEDLDRVYRWLNKVDPRWVNIKEKYNEKEEEENETGQV